MNSKILYALLLSQFMGISLFSQIKFQAYQTKKDISYYSQSDDAYKNERCKLNIYFPEDLKDYPTIIWFHGGGLKEGEPFIPEAFQSYKMAVVAPAYRLHPKVNAPLYLEDAAAAVAWVLDSIASYGGSPEKVFVAGHSAGGYLASMIGMDDTWLKKFGHDPSELMGLIPFSGHAITHMTIRKERGIAETQPIIDEYAPLYHVSKEVSPILLLTGDRELELLGRYEEVAYLWRMLKVAGHGYAQLIEIKGTNHGEMVDPGYQHAITFMHAVQRLKYKQ